MDNKNNKGNERKTENTGKPVPHSKKLVQEPKGNEQNRYSDPECNKMKINYAKELSEAQKNNLKEEIVHGLWIWSTKICRRHSRNSKITKIEN
jgi:hypothetical protein